MKTLFNLMLLICLAAFIGCAGEETDKPETTDASKSGAQYLTDAEPDSTVPVGEARQNTKDGDAVALLGIIGGSTEPFIDGLAAFTIVDPKVNYCPPEEGCPTPWDYCCTQDQVQENIATVKIVDADGKPVAEDARKLLSVKELSHVVVEGTAKRDEQGNLSVLASKVFIKKL